MRSVAFCGGFKIRRVNTSRAFPGGILSVPGKSVATPSPPAFQPRDEVGQSYVVTRNATVVKVSNPLEGPNVRGGGPWSAKGW